MGPLQPPAVQISCQLNQGIRRLAGALVCELFTRKARRLRVDFDLASAVTIQEAIWIAKLDSQSMICHHCYVSIAVPRSQTHAHVAGMLTGGILTGHVVGVVNISRTPERGKRDDCLADEAAVIQRDSLWFVWHLLTCRNRVQEREVLSK